MNRDGVPAWAATLLTGLSRRLPRQLTGAGLVLMLLAVLGLGAGWYAKAPCTDTYRLPDGQLALNWQDYRQYELHCYSDTIPLYGIDRLQEGGLPYKTSWTEPGSSQVHYMEYPVLTGLLQYGVTHLTKWWVRATQEPD